MFYAACLIADGSLRAIVGISMGFGILVLGYLLGRRERFGPKS